MLDHKMAHAHVTSLMTCTQVVIAYVQPSNNLKSNTSLVDACTACFPILNTTDHLAPGFNNQLHIRLAATGKQHKFEILFKLKFL